jgi:putative endonuclease
MPGAGRVAHWLRRVRRWLRPREHTRRDLGDLAEQAAARYLRAHGYRIRERNWRCPIGEIDIIAEQGDAVVIIEVKSRSSTDYARPQANVTAGKRRRLTALARAYLTSKRLDVFCRLEIVEVVITRRGEAASIEVLPASFVDERRR